MFQLLEKINKICMLIPKNPRLISMSTENFTQENLCVECKSTIPQGASVCSICSNYQVRWKNQARFIANIIGVLSVAAALISYVVSAIPSIRRTIAWQDHVSILTYIDSKVTVVANTGDGEVFLSHIYIHFDPENDGSKRTLTRLLDKAVSPGKSVTISQEAWDKYGLITYETVSGVNDDKWADLYAESNIGDLGGCVILDFSSANDPLLNMYKNHLGDNFRTFPVDAKIYYYSLKSGELLTEDFPAYGMLKRSPDPSCNDQ